MRLIDKDKLELHCFISSDLNDYAKGWNDAIKTIMENEPTVNQWISVTGTFPKDKEWVLCQCQANIIDVFQYREVGNYWYKDSNHQYMSGFVLAWQPLPKPYEGD